MRSDTHSAFLLPAGPPTLEACQNLLPRDRMLSDPDPTRIVDGIRYRAGHGPDAGLTETLYTKEPTRF